MRCVFFAFFFFLNGIFSHFRLLMRRCRKNFPIFFRLVESIKASLHFSLLLRCFRWRIIHTASFDENLAFDSLRSVLPSFRRRHFPDFSPLFFHLSECTHTPTLKLLSFFSVFSIPKAQWNCNYFAHTTFQFWPLFFCFIFVRFQFSSPNFFATATENPPLLEAFSGRVFFFLILRDAGQISSLIFSKRRKFYLLTFIGALVYPQKKSSKRYHSLLFSLTTRIFQKRRIQLDTNQSSLTVLVRNKQSGKNRVTRPQKNLFFSKTISQKTRREIAPSNRNPPKLEKHWLVAGWPRQESLWGDSPTHTEKKERERERAKLLRHHYQSKDSTSFAYVAQEVLGTNTEQGSLTAWVLVVVVCVWCDVACL